MVELMFHLRKTTHKHQTFLVIRKSRIFFPIQLESLSMKVISHEPNIHFQIFDNYNFSLSEEAEKKELSYEYNLFQVTYQDDFRNTLL